ncbi:MAG: PFL family protein [Propionibacterium sp.]|nr:PFL family protein [Propionibacterium sp.]MDN6793550.1 PFL family protein [Propionibacterium sp.]
MLDLARGVLDTNRMIDNDCLDIRTVTMGISLLDCAESDGGASRRRIYDKICSRAEHLVETADWIQDQLGVPIINKRISVTPISLVAAASGEDDYVEYARVLERSASEVGVDFIGGFSALVDRGTTRSDEVLMESIPDALHETGIVCSSVNVGSSRAGINMSAVRDMGEVIKRTAEATAADGGIGAAKLVVFANAVGDNPFMAGAFHGVEMPETCVSVGISGPGVVRSSLESVRGESFDVVAEVIKKAAFKITRLGQLVGSTAAQRLGVDFGIVDLSLAPTAEIGDSVGRIIEEMGVERVGAHGTTAALALLNDAVKKGGMMACSNVGGLSGSFIPVSEDIGMIEAVRDGALGLDKLEAMTSICSVGLDMVVVPGETPASTLSAIIADEAAIGVMNHKTTGVRIIPAPGKAIGDELDFGGLLGHAPVMATNPYGSADFVMRGGHIPAPVHGFRN